MSDVQEGTAVKGESDSSSMNPELQQEQYETKARAKGWKPLNEWKGNPEDWVDAKEYLGRQKLFDRIEDLKGELGRQSRKFEMDLQTITSHFERMREADYEKAKAELREKLKEAVRNDDLESEKAIEAKMEKLEEDRAAAQKARQQAAPKQNGPTPEFQQWHAENPWFQTNPEMTQEAIAIGTGYAALHPDKSQKDVLEYTSQRIKKLYPEAFENAEPSQKRSGPSVESGDGGRNKTVSNKKGRLTVADLEPEEREVMRVLIKRGALKQKAAKNKISQEEQYLRDLEEYNAAKAARR